MQIGAYRLGERIASGRLAQVYRGSDRAGRPVAVKLLSPEAELDDPAARDRFVREIDMLSRVRHPNVIALLGHGIDDELGPYLVTPLVFGTTLRAHIARGAALPEVALLGLREVAAGIAAMHAVGVVHRDLKPENIMIQADGHIVVIDLGLAYRQNQTRYTEEGAVAGSVPYMAPEQIEAATISPATDVWALGVILYEWIAGRRPFARNRPTEEVAAILAGRYPPLSQVNPCATEAHDQLIAQCLAPTGQRMRDAQQLLNAINGCLDWPNAHEHSRSAFKNPAGYAEKLRRYRAESLGSEAHKLISRGEVFSATRLIDRGLAYQPSDPELLSLVEAAAGSARPAWRRALPVLAIVVAAAVIGVALLLFGSATSESDSDGHAASANTATPGGGDARVPDATGMPALNIAKLSNEFRITEAALAAYKPDIADRLLPRKQFGGNPYDYAMRPEKVAPDFASQLKLAKAFLATYYKKRGLALLEDLAKRFPKQAELWQLRGFIAARQGYLARADDYYSKAVDLAPHSVEALSRRGMLRVHTGRLVDAYKDLSEALHLDGDNLTAIRGIAQLYRIAKQPRAPAPLLKRAAAKHPKDADLIVDLALASTGKTARELMSRAVVIDQTNKRTIRERCLLLARQKHADALGACDRASLTLYDDIEVTLAAGYAYLRADDIIKARVYFTIAGVRARDDPRGPLGMVAVAKKSHSSFYSLRRALQQACDRGAKSTCTELNQQLKKRGKPAYVPTTSGAVKAVPAIPDPKLRQPIKPIGK